MFVYQVFNTCTFKCYIGKTRSTVEKRWDRHCRAAYKVPTGKIDLAIRLYGKEVFKISVLGEYSTQEELDEAEVYFIKYYKTLHPAGYNVRKGPC